MRFRDAAAIASLSLLSTTAGCDNRPIYAAAALPPPGAQLPEFAFPRYDRPDSLSPAQLRGAPAVVMLWSKHCPYQGPWVANFDSIARIYSHLGIRMVVLADDRPGRALDSALAQASWMRSVTDVGIASGSIHRVFDRSDRAPERKRHRVELVLPSFLLVGSDGRVLERTFGGDVVKLLPALDSLIGRVPPRPPGIPDRPV